jgi:Tfp pilus assembly protein PilF
MISAPRLFHTAVLLALVVTSPGRAQAQQPGSGPGTNSPAASAPATNSAPAGANPVPAQPDAITAILSDAIHLIAQGQPDAALEKVNLAIRLAPQDPDPYGLRASMYAQKQAWPEAQKDYHKVLEIDPANVPAKFDLAEIKFKLKLYDQARSDFAALEKDDALGDLASYRAFLCDLAAGHVDAAGKELDAFNQVGGNASYYFANAAWSLYHHKTEEGRGWLTSGVQIYAQEKVNSYCNGLQDLGYLPLPPAPGE